MISKKGKPEGKGKKWIKNRKGQTWETRNTATEKKRLISNGGNKNE